MQKIISTTHSAYLLGKKRNKMSKGIEEIVTSSVMFYLQEEIPESNIAPMKIY